MSGNCSALDEQAALGSTESLLAGRGGAHRPWDGRRLRAPSACAAAGHHAHRHAEVASGTWEVADASRCRLVSAGADAATPLPWDEEARPRPTGPAARAPGRAWPDMSDAALWQRGRGGWHLAVMSLVRQAGSPSRPGAAASSARSQRFSLEAAGCGPGAAGTSALAAGGAPSGGTSARAH